MTHEVAEAVRLTLTLAGTVTLLLLALATPLAWWLARSGSGWTNPVAAIVALPLVLPPTVLGFYLLIAMGPSGPGGALAGLWGARTLAFSFEGLVLGSVVYSLPFMVQPLRAAFEAIGEEPLEAAASLARRRGARSGASRSRWRGTAMGGAVLSFAHVIGEFGVVLMIGGNIPGETRVLSVAIFNAVERGSWAEAHILSLGMVVFAFAAISVTMLIDRRTTRPFAD